MSSLVPEVWKIVKNGPWDIKTLRKTNFVLILIFYGRNGPWMESLMKLHNRSLKFQSLAKIVPGCLKSEKYPKYPLYYLHMTNMVHFDYFGEITKTALKKSEITKKVLVFCKPKYQTDSLLLLPNPN